MLLPSHSVIQFWNYSELASVTNSMGASECLSEEDESTITGSIQELQRAAENKAYDRWLTDASIDDGVKYARFIPGR